VLKIRESLLQVLFIVVVAGVQNDRDEVIVSAGNEDQLRKW